MDLAAAACAARSTSVVKSPLAYPSASIAAVDATSAPSTGVPRAAACAVTTASRPATASGDRSSHSWSSRPAARTATCTDSGDEHVARVTTPRCIVASIASAMISDTVSPAGTD